MSTQIEITRIQSARDTLRAKAVELGIALTTDKIDVLATKFDANLINRGAVNASVKEGETYTIPKGYHNGSGTVAGVSGGGNYGLQSKEVTPTKATQEITSDSGYYGLSGVTVKPIPSQYQDVSGTTVTEDDVLVTKVFTSADGTLTTGTMPNNGTISTQTLTTTTTSYTIPKGYHSGSGKVQLVTETKTATPTLETQNVVPSTGKVLSKVTVNPIPSQYKDSTGVSAVASNILVDKIVIGKDADGNVAKVTGTMPNNGNVTTQTLSTTKTSYTIPEGYHAGEGKVQIVLETKTATPTEESQTINPTSGKVLSGVTVNPIPSKYKDTTNVDGIAANVLTGKIVIGKEDTTVKEIEGTMTDNGAVALTMDGLTTTSVTVPTGYHNGSGTISLTDDIEKALAAI